MPPRKKRPAVGRPRGKPAKTPVHVDGERVRLLREKRGWSQLELANRIDNYPAIVSLIECNRREIGIPLLVKLARALDCSTDWLLRESDDPSRK